MVVLLDVNFGFSYLCLTQNKIFTFQNFAKIKYHPLGDIGVLSFSLLSNGGLNRVIDTILIVDSILINFELVDKIIIRIDLLV